MSRAVVAKHYARIASQWPKDLIRPEVQFPKILTARTNDGPKIDAERDDLLNKVLGPSRRARSSETEEVNALYSLLENRYMKKSPLPASMLAPQSDPHYYRRLEQELAATPDRSWFTNVTRRIKGMVRFK